MSYRVCRFAAVILALASLAVSCSKPKADVATSPRTEIASSPSASATASPASPVSDYACTLLTKEDALAVQGEAYKDTKPSERTGGGLIISQCYFELPTTVNSIVLTVTRKAPGGRDPSDSWREIFYSEHESKKKEEEGEEKKPVKVDGVGDEAFWTGTRVGGALFVLKGNAYIRISIGGAGDQAQKIEKSKTLAESVLKHL